jgi:hypothetical protein
MCASPQVIFIRTIRTIPRRSTVLHDRSSVGNQPFAQFAQWPGVGITQDDRCPNGASHSHNSHNSFAATSRLPEPVLNSQTGSQYSHYSQNYVSLGLFQGFCELPMIRTNAFNIRTIAVGLCVAPPRRFHTLAIFAQFAELPTAHDCTFPAADSPTYSHNSQKSYLPG